MRGGKRGVMRERMESRKGDRLENEKRIEREKESERERALYKKLCIIFSI